MDTHNNWAQVPTASWNPIAKRSLWVQGCTCGVSSQTLRRPGALGYPRFLNEFMNKW